MTAELPATTTKSTLAQPAPADPPKRARGLWTTSSRSLEERLHLFQRSQTYSRFVGAMKLVLPAAALGLIALIASWPSLHDPAPAAAVHDNGQLTMTNAHYEGSDRKNQPYSVLAVQARQSTSQPGIIDMKRPDAEITLNSGAWVTVRAEHGRFDQNLGRLLLTGDVDLVHDKGYELHSDTAHVDVNHNTAWGNRPVVGQGPLGTLYAQGFRMADNGATIVFTGNARAILEPRSGAPAR